MRRFACPLFALALAGCMQGDGKYPSLLPRAIESQTLAEPERPAPVATPDAALDARIAELNTRLDTAAAAFLAASRSAEALVAVARGVPEGSDSWLEAQTALGGLDSVREPGLSALSDLQQLAIARGQEGLPPYPALEAAVTRAAALDVDQARRIAGLEDALAGR